MVTVTKTSDDDTFQSYSLPDTLSGTVYIRVKDTDQTEGNKTKDTIYIDRMYILSAVDAGPTPTPTPTATPTPTPTATPTPTPDVDMYVNDIDMTWYESKSGYVATATIWIKDEYTNDVDAATVTGAWSGATNRGDTTGQTVQDGKVTLESKAVKGGGTFTFTVTDVSATGYTYNPALNVMDSNLITAP